MFFDIGLSFASRLDEQSLIHVGPSLTIGEAQTTFGISLGLIFSTGSKYRKSRLRSSGRSSAPLLQHPRPEQTDQGYVSTDILARMVEGIPQISTVDFDVIPLEQLILIGHTFNVAPEAIQTFRWGTALAPPNHPHAGTMWFRIQYGVGPREGLLRVRADGSVVQR